ncbi:MAG: hypothetical protein ACR2M3_16145 [Thermomicrobiales bacterium]
MRRTTRTLLILLMVAVATGCGQTQESMLATRGVGTIRAPTAIRTPTPAVTTEADAIHIARTVVSPYIATRENGVWRVIFRNYDSLPNGAAPNDDYWRVPLSVFIDTATGIVLRQGYMSDIRT